MRELLLIGKKKLKSDRNEAEQQLLREKIHVSGNSSNNIRQCLSSARDFLHPDSYANMASFQTSYDNFGNFE